MVTKVCYFGLICSILCLKIRITLLISVTPTTRWGTPTDASAATAAHPLLSSAMSSSNDSDWPVHCCLNHKYVYFNPNDLRWMHAYLASLTVLPQSTFDRDRRQTERHSTVTKVRLKDVCNQIWLHRLSCL